MDEKTKDLMMLIAMAMSNNYAVDKKTRDARIEEYVAHREKCIEKYGYLDTLKAEWSGL